VGDVELDLAQSYERLDPFTWRVELRPEVRFWSGRPVDAPVVVESLARSRELAPPGMTLLGHIQVESEGESSVLFRSESPLPGLPLTLTDEYLVIHNAQAYGPRPNPFELPAADLTGFFKVTGFEPRVRTALARHDSYWGVLPRLARVRMEALGDADARVVAALSGEAHIVRGITSEGASQIDRSRQLRLVSHPTTEVLHAYLNIQRPLFDDVRVRQALAWAVDRDELGALVFDGRSGTAPSWLATNLTYPEARKTGYTRLDQVRAAQLLDAAGWRLPAGTGNAGNAVRTKDGARLRFSVLWFGTGRSLAEVLQAQWGRIGAEVDVQGSTDYGLIQSRRAQNDWDVFVEAWQTDGEPAAVLGRHVAPDGDLNYMKFRDPAIEGLLADFQRLFDPEERRLQALKINERQGELVPFIPLVGRPSLTAVDRRVRNYHAHILPWMYELHPDLWVTA
jgi:peptide/nickel transport system substrate-binding protein